MEPAPPPPRTKVEHLADQFVDAIGYFVHARLREGRHSRGAKETRSDATKALLRLLRAIVAVARRRSP